MFGPGSRRATCIAPLVLSSFALVAETSLATWSIGATDMATGEVAMASATCLPNFDLKGSTPVMVVGRGAGVAQASLGPVSLRQIIWEELHLGTHPADILTLLEQADPGHQQRQYGIVDLLGRVAAHTGSGASGWAGHVTGTVGTITYTIQGNILTGAPVVLEAERALIHTPGDLSEKVMAAMLAARAMGGDGRCSCSQTAPESCGSPPPFFTHSAYVGYVLVSRIGDIDGTECDSRGCAKGTYYLDINVPDGNDGTDDPVFQLKSMFDDWRDGLIGEPDHLLSEVSLPRPSVPIDGVTVTEMTVELRDWQGNLLDSGAADLTVVHAPDSDGRSSIGPVSDNGDGSYSVPITAGDQEGVDQYEVIASTDQTTATLYPYATLDNVLALSASAPTISSSNPELISFDLVEPFDLEESDFLVMMSVSGSSPGMDLGGIQVPLNYDQAVLLSIVRAGLPPFVGTRGNFNLFGQGVAGFEPQPGWLDLLIGSDLTFAFITLDPLDAASNAVTVQVIP